MCIEKLCVEIESCLIVLWVENCGEFVPVGTGILVEHNAIKFLVSTSHVFDMKEKNDIVENDPSEVNIPQDDRTHIYVLSEEDNEPYFKYDLADLKHSIFSVVYAPSQHCFCHINEEDEYAIIPLTQDEIDFFIKEGKRFRKIYNVEFDEILSIK